MQNWCYRVKQTVEFGVTTWRRTSLFSLNRRLPPKAFWWSRIKINVKIISVFSFTVPVACGCVLFCGSIYTHERRALFNTAPESAEQNKLNFGRWHKFATKFSSTLKLFGFECEVLGGPGSLFEHNIYVSAQLCVWECVMFDLCQHKCMCLIDLFVHMCIRVYVGLYFAFNVHLLWMCVYDLFVCVCACARVCVNQVTEVACVNGVMMKCVDLQSATATLNNAWGCI